MFCFILSFVSHLIHARALWSPLPPLSPCPLPPQSLGRTRERHALKPLLTLRTPVVHRKLRYHSSIISAAQLFFSFSFSSFTPISSNLGFRYIPLPPSSLLIHLESSPTLLSSDLTSPSVAVSVELSKYGSLMSILQKCSNPYTWLGAIVECELKYEAY